MKKRLTLSTLIATAIIVVAGIYMYQRFIAPIYNDAMQSINIDFSGPKTVTLVKPSNQNNIQSIELDITGTAEGIIDLKISTPSSHVHTISLKGPEIDYVYLNNWYSDSCLLEIQPRNESKGNLHMDYFFLGKK